MSVDKISLSVWPTLTSWVLATTPCVCWHKNTECMVTILLVCQQLRNRALFSLKVIAIIIPSESCAGNDQKPTLNKF